MSPFVVLCLFSVKECIHIMTTTPPLFVPQRVFIVPYRNRPQQKYFFQKYMSFLLEDKLDYEVYFSHQCDARPFNRGGTKNIGFLAVKEKYPEHYRDMTFIFHDVDTIPFYKIFDYQTIPTVVKHVYGFTYALGGIVIIKGADFERINGFPSFFGWGMEDNCLQTRCERAGITIDRSQFYPIGSPEIMQLFDGITRIINKKDPWRGTHDNGSDGLTTLTQLSWNIRDRSDNPRDNIWIHDNPNMFVLNIHTFTTPIQDHPDEYFTYDLRAPKREIIHPNKVHAPKPVMNYQQSWTHIPPYPTVLERKETYARTLTQLGKPVPTQLVRQIATERAKCTEVENMPLRRFSMHAKLT